MSKIDSKSSKNPLYLDAGNSSVKGAYKEGARWELIHAEETFTAADLVKWLEAHPEEFSHIVASAVREDVREAIIHELRDYPLKMVTVQDIPRDLIDYETVDTLGIDRFLACYGAKSYTRKAVVVIDAGTALTMDFMDRDEVYHGGLIAPGLSGFRQLLSQKAPALPDVEWKLPKTWPGRSTDTSLQWGQAGFYKAAIEGMLKQFRSHFGRYDLFITGGNRKEVASLLGEEDRTRSFLIFDGLERIDQSSSAAEKED